MDYSNWYVGMRVVYTEESDGEWPDGVKLFEIGSTHTVTWIGICDWEEDVMIDLLQYPSPQTEEWCRGYIASNFRPVYRNESDIGVFTSMLKEKDISNAE